MLYQHELTVTAFFVLSLSSSAASSSQRLSVEWESRVLMSVMLRASFDQKLIERYRTGIPAKGDARLSISEPLNNDI